MEDRKRIAELALHSIRDALEQAKLAGRPADVLFLSSELRYILAAHPGDGFRTTLERGDTVYGVPVIRFISEDLEKFFLGYAIPVDPEKGYRELIPRRIYGKQKKGAGNDCNGKLGHESGGKNGSREKVCHGAKGGRHGSGSDEGPQGLLCTE